jgi:TolB-like protein/tetratricopeptide (TPR) repeat protein
VETGLSPVEAVGHHVTDRTDPPGKRSFFAELNHRHVGRAAVIYIGGVWALSQGLAQLAPVFNVPDWVTRWFVIGGVIGFPFWLAFAWYYELTPEGLKRESAADQDPLARRHTARTLDFWIIGILATAVVLLVTNTFVLHRDVNSAASANDAETIAAKLAKVPFQSVAVLPLVNQSGDPKQQYFSDGLSEELISDLTQLEGLKVIGQKSSFMFRDSKDSPAQIGAALGVAHLIQGSVQQQGDRIRAVVSMISTKDGANVWSHGYDEQLKDVFAIQSKIGTAVANALKVKLLGYAIVSSDKPPSGNVRAYELMLQGRAIMRHGTEASVRQGIALFQQALKLDQNYAYTWGLLSNASVNLGVLFLTGDARQQAYAQARAAGDKEQLLAPDAAHTLSDRGYMLASIDNDPIGALAEYQRALVLAPNDTTTMSFVAGGLENLGHLQAAVAMYRKILATDPLRPDIYWSLALGLLGQRQLDAAEQATRKALALQPDFPWLYGTLTQIDVLRGDAGAARRDAAKETDPAYGPWARTLAQQIGPDHHQADAALRDYVAKQGKDQPYLVADLYAFREQPNDMFDWLQRAWTQRDPNFSGLLTDPFVLAYQHDPRFAALCSQAGLPLPGTALPVAASSSTH